MISVCMATFNGEKYISSQLQSILVQLADSDEVIIIDDCSSDRTVEIIRSLNDERIKLLKNEKNIGVVKNFERAIEIASGKYIFLSDQDDVWLPNKVESTLKYLHSGYDLVVSNAYIMKDSTKTEETFFSLRNSGPGLIKNIYKNTFIGCCMAFNADFKKMILPIPLEVSMHDAWIGQIITIFGKVKFIDSPLMFYRRHGENVTDMSPGSVKSILRKRFMDITCLYSRAIRIKGGHR